jgi:hypothetical protein
MREGIDVVQGAVKLYGSEDGSAPAGTTPVNGVLLPVPAKAVIDGAVLVRFV